MKKFFALLLALAMILALSACGEKQQEPSNEGDEQDNTPAQTFNFKVSITQASTDPLATYTQQWMDEVTEKTNGAVTFEFHPNGELGTINDVCEQISRGASIIAYAGPDAFMATAPDLAILNSQYCLTELLQTTLSMILIGSRARVDNLAAMAMPVFCPGITSPVIVTFFLRLPSTRRDDMNGVQIRVADSAAAIAFVKALGASPVVTNWNEVYSSLSTNIVSAAEAPLATLYSSSLQEVAKYCTLTQHLVSTGMMVMPEDIFESMPEEYQQILLDAVYQAGSDFTAYNLQSEQDYQAKMEEAGVTFINA